MIYYLKDIKLIPSIAEKFRFGTKVFFYRGGVKSNPIPAVVAYCSETSLLIVHNEPVVWAANIKAYNKAALFKDTFKYGWNMESTDAIELANNSKTSKGSKCYCGSVASINFYKVDCSNPECEFYYLKKYFV